MVIQDCVVSWLRLQKNTLHLNYCIKLLCSNYILIRFMNLIVCPILGEELHLIFFLRAKIPNHVCKFVETMEKRFDVSWVLCKDLPMKCRDSKFMRKRFSRRCDFDIIFIKRNSIELHNLIHYVSEFNFEMSYIVRN